MNAFFEDDLYFRIIQLIDSISTHSRKHVEKQLKPLNMTYPQMGILMLLHRLDGLSQRELADLTETDTTNIMVICDSLEKRGWIKRIVHESDRRINKICLTEVGKKEYSRAKDILWNGITYIREQTSREEMERIKPFLEELDRHTKALYEGKTEKVLQ